MSPCILEREPFLTIAECTPSGSPPLASSRIPAWLYALFFISGISGLIYEVVWLRMLTRILGNTVYATSTVLAAFMAGVGGGRYLIRGFVHRSARPPPWSAFPVFGIRL